MKTKGCIASFERQTLMNQWSFVSENFNTVLTSPGHASHRSQDFDMILPGASHVRSTRA
jgi:hypothetical protein